MSNIDNDTICCSFCGKPESQISQLIRGPKNVFICDECIHLCMEVITEAEESNVKDASYSVDDFDYKKPMELKAILDEYVIGQEEAK